MLRDSQTWSGGLLGGSTKWVRGSKAFLSWWWRLGWALLWPRFLFILDTERWTWGWISQKLAQSFLAETVVVVVLRNSWMGLPLLLSFGEGENSSLQVGDGVDGPPLFPTCSTIPPFNFCLLFNISTFFPSLSTPFSFLSISPFKFLTLGSSLFHSSSLVCNFSLSEVWSLCLCVSITVTVWLVATS